MTPAPHPRTLLLALGLTAALLFGRAGPAGAQEAAPELPAPEHDSTRELIALVADATALVAARGHEAACREFGVDGSRWLQGETYVFIIDLRGEALCHPARPALEGRGLLEMRDPHGRPIVQTFLRELAAKDDGWVHYLWPRPETLTFFWKTSYIRRTAGPDGEELVVGSGLYEMEMERFFVVEQVHDAVALIEERGLEAFPVFHEKSSGFLFYDAYLFVMDDQGDMLVNVGFPDLEGTSVRNLTDVDGRAFVQTMLEATTERGAAWVDYRWPRPGETKPRPKSSYVRRIRLAGGDTLLVGAGVYF